MSNILIGAPVYDRAWILPHWIEAIEKQNYPLNQIGFVFELGPNDDKTHSILWDFHQRHPEFIIFDAQIESSRPHHSHPDGLRTWNRDKYFNMVVFRNSLLERATAQADQFDYYFSLDSDLLLEDPETLNRLVNDCEITSDLDVVSPLSYMTPKDKAYPSIMYWDNLPGGRAVRNHAKFQKDSLYSVPVVMAAVFMKKHVFTQCRYSWHKQGEDLGFAANMAALNFKSYVDTSIYLPHMMHQSTLNNYLETGIDIRKL